MSRMALLGDTDNEGYEVVWRHMDVSDQSSGKLNKFLPLQEVAHSIIFEIVARGISQKMTGCKQFTCMFVCVVWSSGTAAGNVAKENAQHLE
eukprot:3348544-Amphidinium_carterae.1